MPWERLTPIKGRAVGCLNCGGNHDVFPPDGLIAVGFGHAAVTRDGETVYQEGDDDAWWSGADAEREAAKDPDHDWQISLVAPLREATYQR